MQGAFAIFLLASTFSTDLHNICYDSLPVSQNVLFLFSVEYLIGYLEILLLELGGGGQIDNNANAMGKGVIVYMCAC